jgi:hypothetical protein
MGAAVATVITEVFVLALLVGLVRDLPVWPLPWRPIGVVSVATAGAAATAFAAEQVAGWIGAGVAATLVYAGLLHLFGIEGRGGLPAFVRSSRELVVENSEESVAGAGIALASPSGELSE